jgi:V/A-type H+-transporting ATPase subunit A
MLPIIKVSGPLVTAQITNNQDKPKILETVYVGKNRLLGEIISIQGDECKVQVYEETTGLQIGESVELKDELLSVELGPGLLGNIFDGIQRPLSEIDKISPIFIQPGLHLPSLDQNKKWRLEITTKPGDSVDPGQRLGYVQETENVKHWILAPHNIVLNSSILEIKSGLYTLSEVVGKIKSGDQTIDIKLSHKWPVKIARPIASKLSPSKIFKTGQRVIDAMFPILLGAPVSTPGPFGAGKTFTQQQLAKWSNAQIVVYVGCGERGNEMTEMVKLFPELSDPRTGRPLMERTVLIANTSNMPIAAREASIYTGMTIAEYYRDMGYDVVLMADSTSRWAEAMREISARLGEMPADEGYPAYLSSRISEFYERAGVVSTLSKETGSITAVGTVSPAGGDFSDPVTQASLKSTQVFLALDAKLAAKRHYPSINWQTSYSLYEQPFTAILNQTESGSILAINRVAAKKILNEEDSLLEMVKLVGFDGLNNLDRLTMEIAKSLREDFLQQNGFDPADTYCSFEKLEILLDTIMSMYNKIAILIESKPDNENLVAEIFNPRTKYLLSQMKYQTEISEIQKLQDELFNKINEIATA